MRRFFFYIVSFTFLGCQSETPKGETLFDLISNWENISGNEEYMGSPYVTAGNRVYQVGHQDGTFPDLGWHVEGEMGGIWDHPIKLMDGFQVQLEIGGDSVCLDTAEEFINYPFANILKYTSGDLKVSRLQFVPDNVEGLVIQMLIENSGKEKEIGLNFTGLVDLMPVWLAERKNLTDGSDEGRYNSDYQSIVAKDQQNEWYVTFGSDRSPDFHGMGANPCNAVNKGNGIRGSLRYNLSLEAKGQDVITFFISGSYSSLEDLWSTYEGLKSDYSIMLQKKMERYRGIASTANLEIEDKEIEQMYRWIKYNTDWLVRDVPEVGSGLSAGIPDYPWWFGTDAGYIIQGLVSAGMHQEAISTIDLIMKLSKEANGETGKIMHEASTNGIVFNPGNLNTTPTFIHALWRAYAWTGDERLLNYYEDVKNGISWIEEQDENGNGYPDGAGMMEIHGLDSEMIDVVAYLFQSYLAAANFAEVMGDAQLAESYRSKAQILKEKINSEWWVEEAKSFADFRSSQEKFMESLLATKERMDTIPDISQEIRESMINEVNLRIAQMEKGQHSDEIMPQVIHHNWVVNTPMEVLAANSSKAAIALETGRNYTSRFGMYVTGIDKKEEKNDATKWKAFSYVSAVMTLPTGVQAIGELNYGNPDQALKYMKMLQNSFSYALPGSMYEVSPDYGMIAQGWNIYAVATPVVDYFFGVKPKAYEKTVLIDPLLPSAWKTGKLSSIKVGGNLIDIEFTTDGESKIFTVEQSTPDWQINFAVPVGASAQLNGEPSEGSSTLGFTGGKNEVTISY